jgi:hypothetical protein
LHLAPPQAFADALTALNFTAAELLADDDLVAIVLGHHASATVYTNATAVAAARTITTLDPNDPLTVFSNATGTYIRNGASNATILRSGFTGLIQPNGSAVSVCRHTPCACSMCT